PQSIRHLIDVIGSEKIVLGTDAPFDMGEMAPVDRVEMTPGLTQKERDNIYCNAALALFDGKI
ncbi:MAG: amidohydrolase family protein, partial [Burkholderiales bacterium]